ncbi:hypothetical protein TNCV_3548111 [Trichonephila clavipes]|nr:hypothetical protein TNCV_3548111 [Trichonephila clavipes]
MTLADCRRPLFACRMIYRSSPAVVVLGRPPPPSSSACGFERFQARETTLLLIPNSAATLVTPLLNHYPHFTAASRKTRSPLNSSLQKSFEMSRSKPRSSAHWSAAARPIAMFHTSSMKTQQKALSPNRLFARYGIKGSLKPR